MLNFRNFAKYGGLQIREEDCSYVWQVPEPLRCSWVKETASCASSTSIQYSQILFCTFGTKNILFFVIGLCLVFFWLSYLFLILGTTADNFFCPSLSTIATTLRLSENIAGVTILAFGNGAPDIFTSLVSSQDEGIIVFTELMGAGVFVTAIIAGSVAVAKPFKISPKFFIRDCSFYLFAVCCIMAIIWDEIVHLWEAISLIVLYLLYILVVVLMQVYDSRRARFEHRIPTIADVDVLKTYFANREATNLKPQIPRRERAYSVQAKLDVAIARELRKTESPEETPEESSDRPTSLFGEFLFDANPVNRTEWESGNVRTKALLLIRAPFMLVLQLIIPVVNETSRKRGWSKMLNCVQIAVTPILLSFLMHASILVIAVTAVSSIAVSTVVFFLTRQNVIPKYHDALAFAGFLTAMFVVYTVAQEVMSVLECIGFASGISQAMLGITFLTWGNSIGDLISNLAIAKRGFPRMGYSACFGGPMFNTLLGFGLTYGIAAGADPGYKIKIRTSDMSSGCLAFLLCSLFTSMIYLNVTGFRARRSYGFLLFCVYGAFMLINLLSELHIIHPLGTDHRADEFDVS